MKFLFTPNNATRRPYPTARHLVVDLIREGRRKNLFHVLFEIDITDLQQHIKHYAYQYHLPLSLTTYLIKAFASTIYEDRSVQAYRQRRHLITFDDVNVCVMIERNIDNHLMPIAYTIRAAHRKSLRTIVKEIQYAKSTPLGTQQGPMPAMMMQFFKLPTFLRKIVWRFIQRHPHWLNQFIGTVGVTSTHGYSSESSISIVDAPLTLTLCIGGIDNKVTLMNEKPVERYFMQLALCVDHDIIDGAPVRRFIERFKQTVYHHEALLCT